MAEIDALRDPGLFFVKAGVAPREYEVHTRVLQVAGLRVPQILCYDPERQILIMEKVPGGMSIADFYGADFEAVPSSVVESVRSAVGRLVAAGVAHPDLTGYNFMLDEENQLWCIDFGHAQLAEDPDDVDPFIRQFVTGAVDSWNPEFL